MMIRARWYILLHLAVFLLGFLYRMWFIQAVPQFYAFDQGEYQQFAQRLISYRLYVSPNRLYGYPLFLAAFYSLFGEGNDLVWQIPQAVLDSVSGLFVFLLGRALFRNRKIAWVSYICYLINPYTPGYAGVRLAESLTIAVLAGIFVLTVRFLRKKEWRVAIAGSFLLSYLVQVKPTFLFLSIFLFGNILLLLRKSLFRTLRTALLSVALFFFFTLPFVYNVLGNLAYFNQVAPLTVTNLFIREFYISLYITNSDTLGYIPSEVNQLYIEYSMPVTKVGRQAMSQKYLTLAKEKVMNDPMVFVLTRVQKMWSVWEQHSFYVYRNPDIPWYRPLSYWLNIGILAGALLGFVAWIRRERVPADPVKKHTAVLVVILVVYTSLIHAFAMTTGRFSIPVYPLLCLFAGYAIFLGTTLTLSLFKNRVL